MEQRAVIATLRRWWREGILGLVNGEHILQARDQKTIATLLTAAEILNGEMSEAISITVPLLDTNARRNLLQSSGYIPDPIVPGKPWSNRHRRTKFATFVESYRVSVPDGWEPHLVELLPGYILASTKPGLAVDFTKHKAPTLLVGVHSSSAYTITAPTPHKVANRIRLLLPQDGEIITIGPIALNTASKQIRVDGEVEALSTQLCALAKVMMKHEGQMLTLPDLREKWSWQTSQGVWVYAHYLRNVLGDYLETVTENGVRGYKLTLR